MIHLHTLFMQHNSYLRVTHLLPFHKEKVLSINMNNNNWSSLTYTNYDEEDDEAPPTLFKPSNYNGNDEYCWSTLDWKNEFDAIEESYFHDADIDPLLMDQQPIFPLSVLHPHPPFSSFNHQQNLNSQSDLFHGVWNELWDAIEPHHSPPLFLENYDQETSKKLDLAQKPKKRRDYKVKKSDSGSSSSGSNNSKTLLSRNTISNCFYMPITQAAKELKIGLTLLKKRCRELGIRRWPHRKLMSLQTLINNVQGMENKAGEGSERKLKEVVDVLEMEKKYIEDVPDLQLDNKTKRLRQAYFKANYKKRKLMSMTMVHPDDEYQLQPCGAIAFGKNVYIEEDDEELKYLLSDEIFFP